MDRRAWTSLGLGVMLAACASGALQRSAVHPPPVVESLGPGVTDGIVQGIVRDADTGETIAGALMILQCSCLQGNREMQTDANGVYNFRRLPAGKYTVQVLYGQSNVSRAHGLEPATSVRLDFQIVPGEHFVIT